VIVFRDSNQASTNFKRVGTIHLHRLIKRFVARVPSKQEGA